MKVVLLSVVSIIWCSIGYGQKINTDIPDLPYGLEKPRRDHSVYWEGWRKVELPFELVNDLMIVEVVLNGTFPLKFIFDTGAEHTILNKIEMASLMGMRYSRKFTIMGADMKTELYAYLVRNVDLKVGRLFSPNEAILVLEEDYFNFEGVTGMQIHGILGANFFRQFVLDINYRSKTITFIKPSHFKRKNKGYQTIPIEVYRNKPYLYADVDLSNDSIHQVKLLLDTGASLPLLIYTDTDTTITIPPNSIPGNVGRGLGGYLEGYQGRVESLAFADFSMGNVLTSFQKSDSLMRYKALNDRNGIIGNQILKRFEVTIDYWNEEIYLKPNRLYPTSFKYDRSGLVILASGKSLNKFTVQRVLPDSPADRAGIKVGDVVIRMNGLPTRSFTMQNVTTILQKRVGKKIKMVVKRDGEKMKFVFRLEELL